MATDLSQDTFDSDISDGFEDARDQETTLGDDSVWEPTSTETQDDDDAGEGPARDAAGRFVSRDGADEPTEGDSGIDSDVRDMARRVYGLTDEELGGFSSTEQLQTTLRLIDQRMRSSQPQGAAPQQQTPSQPQTSQEAQQQAVEDALAQVDLSGFDEDDPIRKGFEALTQEVRNLKQGYSQAEQFMQSQQQSEAQRRVSTFENTLSDFVSELDPVLYGKPGSRTPAQEQLIDELKEPAAMFIAQKVQEGEDFYSLDMKPFFRAAAYAQHADRLNTPQTQQRHPQADQIERRSKRRTSAAQRNHISKATVPSNMEQWDPEEDDETMAKVNAVFERAANR